jgi:hypothetical protein
MLSIAAASSQSSPAILAIDRLRAAIISRSSPLVIAHCNDRRQAWIARSPLSIAIAARSRLLLIAAAIARSRDLAALSIANDRKSPPMLDPSLAYRRDLAHCGKGIDLDLSPPILLD